ncbi:MAG: Asp-tRNA(Asn)/Glu-tRNA(Gln) amidotransferase subunit GatB [Candidatus Blackburnbacteria bacterium]|nr:Asp-tRNA(Asn)/Glu-tRNA(Gln) amidotransferase subunit GatB [Candidatus Blackburnbacteria bacterium]
MKYTPVIGLEVHVELGTRSKMFCSCSADHFAKKPNMQTCPVCLGLPGALPVPNEQAIRWAQLLGAALECKLAKHSKFDRKHYFYPDLPKGYQISQYDLPLAESGIWNLESGDKVRIKRVHLEEDTGKLIHQKVDGKEVTLVDFNRSGVPLVEIVTEPDFTSSDEVGEFVKELRQLVRDLGISDADMEKGSMRLEANISVRPQRFDRPELTVEGHVERLPDYKVELKNINSFRFTKNAVEYEIKRQAEMLDNGEMPIQETRGYDETRGVTRSQRTKEEAQDYRYFPEPDIPALDFTREYLDEIRKGLPELPRGKRQRIEKEYGVSNQYAIILTQTQTILGYFEEAVQIGKKHGVSPKEIANVIVNKKPDREKISPAKLVEMLRGGRKTAVLSNEELEKAVLQSIKENPKAVEDYKKGKEGALQFLLGQIMSTTRGRALPQEAMGLLKQKVKV